MMSDKAIEKYSFKGGAYRVQFIAGGACQKQLSIIFSIVGYLSPLYKTLKFMQSTKNKP